MQLISVTGDQTDYISPGSHSRARRATNRMKSNARIKCLSQVFLTSKVLFWLSKKEVSQNVWMEKRGKQKTFFG